MAEMSPEILKLAASAAFGISAMLLGLVAYYAMRAGSGADVRRDPSQRRAERRRQATQRSALYAFLLALLHIPSAFIAKLELEFLRRYVRKPYMRAGYPGGMDDDEVLTLAFLLALVGGGITAFLIMVFAGPRFMLAGVLGLPFGFLLVISSLQNRAEKRQRQILVAMPYVLDLLVLILRAGTSLNLALARVVADYANHPVGEELGQMLSEIEMGAPRAEAIKRLADRLEQPDINALADSMIQSEELGWPLAETLSRQADRMAAERVLAAQAKAGAAGVWVMLPSTLVLVGAMLLFFGPIIVRFMLGGYTVSVK